MSRKTLVAGNWKMNASTAAVQELVAGIMAGMGDAPDVEVAVFPPAPYLSQVQNLAADSGLRWGGQDVSEFESGAYTGELAASMLSDFGCHYVLVGHSERRSLFGDSNERVAAKVERAQSQGLIPVLCVGEQLADREQGRTEAVVSEQLDAVLERIGVQAFSQLIVAYEPVWAIGTGRTASPQQAQDVHAFIRSKLAAMDDTIASRLRILYGGSVKGSNAAELFAMEDIDGGLIGGASLAHENFLDICRA